MISLGRSDVPRAPWEVREEVELYAREHGRTGTVELVAVPGGFACWVVKLSLRPNDERMRAYQEGRSGEPVPEMVWLMDHDTGKALDIQQMGAAGVRRFLDRGNTWSGRGEFASVSDAVRTARERDEAATARAREQAKEENRYERREKRRQYLQIPAIPVGIDLKRSKE